MVKTYADYMNEISPDELYKGLLAHGLFCEKLPPIFTSEHFYNYTLGLTQPFSKEPHGYVFFESMRDINVPRPLAIPNPMAYQRLCACLRDNWGQLQNHFSVQTAGNTHKISRIHIRKQKSTKSLFKMNYRNWKTDDSPIPDILIGKRYMVSADISTCFPSMYTHALCWAIATKKVAKTDRSLSSWYNLLDHRCMALKNEETHGFLIGPHASNVLSEIILTVVDRHLSNNGWQYIRNIDDYTCYVESYEEAQAFLIDLTSQLRCFDLPLNHKKTKIEELPAATSAHWVRQLNAFDFSSESGKVELKKIQAYLDLAVELMYENGKNAATINYAIKALSKRELTKRAQEYCVKTALHLADIFPYIIPLLDEYIFTPFQADCPTISKFANLIYSRAIKSENYEAAIYAIYFSLKYDFDIPAVCTNIAIQKESCLLKVFTWIYFLKRSDKNALKELKNHAKILRDSDMDEYWLFIYEVLPQSELKGEWKPLKRAGITFLKPI